MYSVGTLTDGEQDILDELDRDARYDDAPPIDCDTCGGDRWMYDPEYGYTSCPFCSAGYAVAEYQAEMPHHTDDTLNCTGDTDLDDVPF